MILKVWRYLLLFFFKGEYVKMMQRNGFIVSNKTATVSTLYSFYYKDK